MGNLKNLFEQAVGNALDQRGKPAKLGRPDGTLYWVDANGMTHRTRVWARIGESQSNQEVVVDCVKVSPQVDMPVRIDTVNGVLTVVDTDGRQAVEFTGGRGGGNVAPHAWLHSRLGPDPLYIDGLQYLPLAVTPTATPDLTVTVQSGVYRDTSGDLQVFDTAVSGSLSSYVPATDYHFVIICLDRANDTIVIVDGADITAEDVLFSDVVVTAADIEAVAIDATYAPLAVVLLYAGQTAVRAKDIVRDLRGASSISGGGLAGGSDTQLQYNKGGVLGGAPTVIYNDLLNDFTIQGDGNNSLFTVDYSTNTIGFGTNGAAETIAKFSPTGIVYNEDGQDVDFRVEGDNLSNLFKVDAGLDAVQIGTGAAGTIADFRSSAILLNPQEADRDTIISGNGVTNGIVYDAGNNRTGFGTGTPTATVYIDNTEASGTPENALVVDNTYSPSSNPGTVFPGTMSLLADYDSTVTPSGGFALAQFLRVRNVSSGVLPARCLDIQYQNLGSGTVASFVGANIRTPTNSGGGAITQAFGLKIENQNIATTNYAIYTDAGTVRFGDGVILGAPTGGNKGAGWLNVAGGVSLNNSNYANPDYALHHHFHGGLGPFADNPGADKYGGLVPLDKLENYLRKHSHLPNRWESQNIFEWADMAQMWCEELAIYITQLHKRVKELENGR